MLFTNIGSKKLQTLCGAVFEGEQVSSAAMDTYILRVAPVTESLKLYNATVNIYVIY